MPNCPRTNRPRIDKVRLEQELEREAPDGSPDEEQVYMARIEAYWASSIHLRRVVPQVRSPRLRDTLP